MSALQLVRPKTVSYTGQCVMEGCQRNGRQRLVIAGWPVLNPSKISLSKFEWLCDPCAKAFKKSWTELSGAEELGEVEAAIARLKEPVPARTEAIFALRAFGLSRDDIAKAMQGVGEGLAPEQVLERVCGEEIELQAAA